MHIQPALILSALIVVEASAPSVPAYCRQVPVASERPALALPAGAAAPVAAPVALDSSIAAAVVAARPAAETHAPAAADSPSGFSRFVRDVGGDYKGFFSKGVALRLGIGGTAAGIVHIWDSDIADEAAEPAPATTQWLDGGDIYGGPTGQWPLAIGWWTIGHFAGSAKGAAAGRDLVRAQISVASWTYAIKFATSRERPNGDPRAFPSGHTSSTFATATVLERYYGWKVGVPFYALGVYAGLSRITAEKHWASDVVFGAAVGIASGYTVTRHVHAHSVTLGPAIYPAGAGLSVTVGP